MGLDYHYLVLAKPVQLFRDTLVSPKQFPCFVQFPSLQLYETVWEMLQVLITTNWDGPTTAYGVNFFDSVFPLLFYLTFLRIYF